MNLVFKLLLLCYLAIVLSLLPVTSAKINPQTVNIVLVHGALADGSSWSKVIPILQAAGHSVTAVQQPLSSIDDDVAKTKSVLARTPGPIVLVGHSFGGIVITQAGHNASNVAALVYVAAFAPEQGESVADLGKNFTALPSATAFINDTMGRLILPQDKFLTYFCPDVEKNEAKVMAAVQGPCDAARFGYTSGAPAWKEHPSYYIVAEKDQIINPKMEAFFAKRMKAKKTITVPTHGFSSQGGRCCYSRGSQGSCSSSVGYAMALLHSVFHTTLESFASRFSIKNYYGLPCNSKG